MKITALRILPPFVIARVGSADVPAENYVLKDNAKALDFRTVEAAPTFAVKKDGTIEPVKVGQPARFRDGKHIRPVSPFLEVWAETDEKPGILQPLTIDMLPKKGAGDTGVPGIEWRVRVANRKVFRRTADLNDIVEAHVQFADHKLQPLQGHCANFVAGGFIGFGAVQFIKPTRQFGQIRLRFTPGKGAIYGPDETDVKDPEQRFKVDPAQAVYRKDGKWVGYIEKTDEATGTRWFRHGGSGTWQMQRNDTLPTSLFAIYPPVPSWEVPDELSISRGYLDDTCDGFVEVALNVDGRELFAQARICAAPPAPVLDSYFIRTLADDLDQVIYGPELPPGEPLSTTRDRAREILRRAFETVRFLNVELMNGDVYKGNKPDDLDTMPELEGNEITGRPVRPVFEPERRVNTQRALTIHTAYFTAGLSGASYAGLAGFLREPHEAADFTDAHRRKMPALMIGADENYLALTYRQIDTIRKAVELPSVAEEPTDDRTPREKLWPRNDTARVGRDDLSAQLRHTAAGNPESSGLDFTVANTCPGLETDFRAVWRRIFKGIVLREHDNLVMDADGPHKDLIGHRVLRVDDELVMARIRVPEGGRNEPEFISTPGNPYGLHPLEWSNRLARILFVKKADGTYTGTRKTSVTCDFSLDEAWDHQVPWHSVNACITRIFDINPFFEGDTAVIAEALARPGELTQGLCSPWQNDFRECSCYYWASARPDFVNMHFREDGVAEGDNWFQKERTGDYVPDDYENPKLVMYDDLFEAWEEWIRFQIGGKDAPGEKP